MIRRLLITSAAALAGMLAVSAALGPAKSAEVPMEMGATYKLMPKAEQREFLADMYQIGYLYNYCEGYHPGISQEVGEFALWGIAQAYGLTTKEAADNIDSFATSIRRKTAPDQRDGACLSAAETEAKWRDIIVKAKAKPGNSA